MEADKKKHKRDKFLILFLNYTLFLQSSIPFFKQFFAVLCKHSNKRYQNYLTAMITSHRVALTEVQSDIKQKAKESLKMNIIS